MLGRPIVTPEQRSEQDARLAAVVVEFALAGLALLALPGRGRARLLRVLLD